MSGLNVERMRRHRRRDEGRRLFAEIMASLDEVESTPIVAALDERTHDEHVRGVAAARERHETRRATRLQRARDAVARLAGGGHCE